MWRFNLFVVMFLNISTILLLYDDILILIFYIYVLISFYIYIFPLFCVCFLWLNMFSSSCPVTSVKPDYSPSSCLFQRTTQATGGATASRYRITDHKSINQALVDSVFTHFPVFLMPSRCRPPTLWMMKMIFQNLNLLKMALWRPEDTCLLAVRAV